MFKTRLNRTFPIDRTMNSVYGDTPVTHSNSAHTKQRPSTEPVLRPPLLVKVMQYCRTAAASAALLASYSVAEAQTLPAMRFENAEPVSPSDAYGQFSAAVSPQTVGQYDIRIAELSEALEGDWEEICLYAQSQIELSPMFGLQKGDVGALQGRRGTSFDQAQLIVNTYRAAGGSASYRFGRVSLTRDQAENMFSVSFPDTNTVSFIEDYFSSAGMPVSVGAGGNSIELLHVWAAGSVNGTNVTCDPSSNETRLIESVDLPTNVTMNTQSLITGATSNTSTGATGGAQFASGANPTSVRSALVSYANQVNAYLDANGLEFALLEDVVGGERLLPAHSLREQNYQVLQETSWNGEIPNEFRVSVRIVYDLAGIDETIYADEFSGDRLTMRWWSNDGSFPRSDIGSGGLVRPTSRRFEIMSGHISLRELERTNSNQLTEYVVADVNNLDPSFVDGGPREGSSLVTSDVLYGTRTAPLQIELNFPYVHEGGAYMDRVGMDAINKEMSSSTQNEFVLSIGGMTLQEKLGYEEPARQDRNRNVLPEGSTIDIRLAPDAGIEDVDNFPNFIYWQHGFNQSFDISTEKDILWRTWAAKFDDASDLLSKITESKIHNHYHVGLVSGRGNNAAESDGSGGILWLDIESGGSVVNPSATPERQRAIGHTLAAFGSTLEGIAIEETLLDYFNWSGQPDTVPFVLDDVTKANTAIKRLAEAADSSDRIFTFTSADFNASALINYPIEVTNKISGFLNADPDRVVTVLETWSNSPSRQNPILGISANGISFLITGDGAEFIKGAEAPQLTAIGSVDYIRMRTEDQANRYPGSVDPETGFWIYSATDLTTGSGDFPHSLSLERSFSFGIPQETGPLRHGWRHNWDISAELDSSIGELLRPGRAKPAAVTIGAMLALVDIFEGDVNPTNALVAAVLMNEWSSFGIDNTVTITGVGVFPRLANDAFVAPPIAGMESTNVAIDSGSEDIVFTRSDQSVMRFQKLNPTDFCQPGSSCSRARVSRSGGTTGPSDDFFETFYSATIPARIFEKQYLVSWDFPYGAEIDLEYSSATGSLLKVSNHLGRELNFEYEFDNACPAGSPLSEQTDQQPCRDAREQFNFLTRIETEDGRWVEYDYMKDLPNPNAGSTYHGTRGNGVGSFGVFDTETGAADTSATPRFFMGQTTTVGNDGNFGFEVYDRHSTTQPILTVELESFFDLKTTSQVKHLSNANDQTWNFLFSKGRFQSTDPLNHATTTYFDDRGNTVRTVSARDIEGISTYDNIDRIVETRLRRMGWPGQSYEARTTREYDDFGNVTEEQVHPRTVASTSPEETGETIVPTEAPLVTKRTYGAGNFQHLLRTVTDPRNIVTVTNEYNAVTGLMESTAGPEGELKTYSYDTSSNAFGRPTRTVETLDIAVGQSLTTDYFYEDQRFNLTRMVADVGGFDYQTSYAYDAAGNLTSVTDPRLNSVGATYDVLRRMSSIRAADGGGAHYYYDNRGLMLCFDEFKVADAAPGTCNEGTNLQLPENSDLARTFVSYSPTGRPLTVTEPSGDVTRYAYDGRDLLQDTIDADGITMRNVYFGDGLVDRVVKGVGTPLEQTEARFWYDAADNMTRLRPARGSIPGHETVAYDSNFESDVYGRTGHITRFPDNTETRNDYNLDGTIQRTFVRQYLDANAGSEEILGFAYDNSSRMTGSWEQVGLNGARRNEVSYVYDEAGRIKQENEIDEEYNSTPTEQLTIAYDPLSRVISETQNGQTVSYGYDAASNRTRITWPDAQSAIYGYDSVNRLRAASFAGINLITYDYDVRSRLEDGIMGNGTVSAFGYTPDSELNALTYSVSDEGGIAEALAWNYGYTRAGRLSWTHLTDPKHPEWKPLTLETISYDQANVADQYTNVTGYGALTHDDRGNLTGHKGRSYTFDFRNRLVTANASGTAITYDYDVRGRRKSKIVGGQPTDYLHAGDMEIAEYSDAGALLRRYIPGGAIDQRVAMIEGSGTTDIRYYHADRLGNVAALTNSAGQVSERYAYDPFGNECSLDANGMCVEGEPSASGNPFRYTGRRYDPETNLYFYRARYYDAELGRFLSTDPVGYEDQWNLYTYVANDPLNKTDPSGQQSESVMDERFVSPNLSNEQADIIREQHDQISETAAAGIAAGATLATPPLTTAKGIGVLSRLLPKSGRFRSFFTKFSSPKPTSGAAGGPGAGRRFSQGTNDAGRAQSGNRCVFCKQPTDRVQGSPRRSNGDHAIPKSRGGNNSPSNQQNTCATCNNQKGARTTEEFLRDIENGERLRILDIK